MVRAGVWTPVPQEKSLKPRVHSWVAEVEEFREMRSAVGAVIAEWTSDAIRGRRRVGRLVQVVAMWLMDCCWSIVVLACNFDVCSVLAEGIGLFDVVGLGGSILGRVACLMAYK